MAKLSNFISADTKIESWEDLKPYFGTLIERQIGSVEELEKFILNADEVGSVFAEKYARAYINMTCHTDNKDYGKLVEVFSTQIEPEVSKASNAITKKIAASEFFDSLPEARYGQLKKYIKRELEMFRKENVEIDAKLSQLRIEFSQLAGSLIVNIDGEDLPLPVAGKKLKSSNRAEREKAWHAIQETRYSKRDAFNAIYDKMLPHRDQIAKNAGYDNYRDYTHDNLMRFDYTAEDVFAFHDAVEKYVKPIAADIRRKKIKSIGLETSRPWDADGTPEGEKPLEPFKNGDELLEKGIRIFDKLRPEFADNLRKMKTANLFDLDSRKGKAPGGYNYGLEVTGMPFIFMNAAGQQRDLVTLMHEGGHAMHTFLTADEPLMSYRHTGSEMAETASMSMELMTAEHWTEFYNDEDYRRARREHLEGTITFLPWCMTVDALQHWVYLNPGHSAEEREAEFEKIQHRFSEPLSDWTGLEQYRANAWQRQLHIFEIPFYYIEYGIAQLGALQMYRNFKKNPVKTLENYRAGLALGGTRGLRELWTALGIDFDFSADKIRELMEFVKEELALFE